MIYVLATLELAAGQREEFLAALRANVPHVLAEKGCLEYAPAVDLPTDLPVQEAARNDVVTVVERWQDLESLQAHLAAPHMVKYREQVRGRVVRTTLRVLEPA